MPKYKSDVTVLGVFLCFQFLAISSRADTVVLRSRRPSSTTCQEYPIRLELKPGAKEAVARRLLSLAPKAQMDWDNASGTFTSVSNLNLKIANCSGDADAGKIFEEAPELFQIDRKEWTPNPLSCRLIREGVSMVRFSQSKFGPYDFNDGMMTLTIERSGKDAIVKSAIGRYLPMASERMLAKMNACKTPDLSSFEASLRELHLPYRILSRCEYKGDGVYRPNQKDKITFRGQDQWIAGREFVPVSLTKTAEAFIEVDKSNQIPELISSDAYCNGKVGFTVSFDPIKGNVIGISPGTRNCTVCRGD